MSTIIVNNITPFSGQSVNISGILSAETLSVGGSIFSGVTNYTEVTYQELVNKISGSTLTNGSYYLITDFKTCYDQPDYDYNQNPIISNIYKDDTPIEPIVVIAISSNKISNLAYQPTYPNDKIKYDWTFSGTEKTQGVAYGRISERIDEFNNRTDYDHRQIKFKRYLYWEIELDIPYDGTVEVIPNSATEMTVSGTNTNFTSLSVNSKIGFQGDFRVFEIVNIVSDFIMIVTGLTTTSLSQGNKFYPSQEQGYVSYHQNNINTDDFEENYTFDFENNENFNNYVGDFSNRYYQEGNDFILANNVFKGGRFRNNKFGDYCYNNTFDDDCSENTVGSYFYGNITNDDFDGNIIGNWFRNNKITSNFQYNRIGENFQDNYLVQNSFYRNNIMNSFTDNKISNGSFQNNEIGNQFNNNSINTQFYKNDVGNGFNNNNIIGNFYGNLIGNGFNNNNVNCNFYDNKLGEEFSGNRLGDEEQLYDFYKNDIGSDFYENICSGTFAYNKIGSNFFGNIIDDGFGYGFNTSQGNVIGNYFNNNNIGEYFYNNTISDGFFSNTVYHYFQNNNVKIPGLNNVDFTEYYNNISEFTFTQFGNSATNGMYTNLTGLTNGDGIGASFNVEVLNGAVDNVIINSYGKFYSLDDTLIILGSQIGGTDGIDDILIRVTEVSSIPLVYENFNCDLFLNSGNNYRLSYFEKNDTLTVTDINL